jgi:hypothetical protein
MAYDDGVAAFGTASGAVGVAAISGVSRGYDDGNGWVAEQPTVVYAHPPAVEGQDLQLRALHGDYGGGGITALALRGALCVSGGRDGAVKAFAVDRGGGEPSLSGSAATLNVGAGPVSGVAIGASGRAIYAVALDGSVKAFSRGEDGSWAEAWSAFVPSPLLCVALDERRGAVIVGSDSGAAHAYSLADGSRIEMWQAHERSGCRSLVVAGSTVYAGSNDGAIRGFVVEDDVFKLAPPARDGSNPALLPPHGAAVVALAATPRGLLCSASRDGSLRVWAVDDGEVPHALYGFGGYKVWIGSLAADDAMLISDGSDNTIICHKFDEERTRSNLNSMCYTISRAASHGDLAPARQTRSRRWMLSTSATKPARGNAVGNTQTTPLSTIEQRRRLSWNVLFKFHHMNQFSNFKNDGFCFVTGVQKIKYHTGDALPEPPPRLARRLELPQPVPHDDLPPADLVQDAPLHGDLLVRLQLLALARRRRILQHVRHELGRRLPRLGRHRGHEQVPLLRVDRGDVLPDRR